MALDANPHDEGVQFFFAFLGKLVDLMESGAMNDKLEAISLAKEFDIQQHDNKLTPFVKGLGDDAFRARVRQLLKGDSHEVISRINEVLLPNNEDANPPDEPSA